VQDFGLIAELLGGTLDVSSSSFRPAFATLRLRCSASSNSSTRVARNVVEFRHSSWWNEKVYRAFRDSGTIFCSTSGPRLPDELIRTADDVYVRFHGTEQWYRHNYTREELAVWAKRVQQSGAARVWAYFNNDREGYAIENARELRRQLLASRSRLHAVPRRQGDDA
jgi:uncharacterized protein YecE (DUF72 family)